MTIERWKEILGKLKDDFAVEDEGSERLEEEGGVDIEYIIFKGPLGRMRLEFIAKPVVLDKKTIYSKRIGSETKVEYVYGEEKSHTLNAYKWDDNEDKWIEMDAAKFNL
jgi:hypothetical protein